MSNVRYIEVNSNYRNRNIWPLSSEFEIPISQSGTNSSKNAVDPVSLAMPVFSWTSNNFTINTNPVLQSSKIPDFGGTAIIATPTSGAIAYSSDIALFVILTSQSIQQLRNYYSSLIILDSQTSLAPNNPIRRIAYSYFLGNNSYGYKTQITLVNPFSDSVNLGDTIVIQDPTDFTDTFSPLIFVPNGSLQENAYNSYILYNETCNQYRPILHYDNATNIIQLDTTGSSTSTYSSGPIIVGSGNWQTTDNFSLRTTYPMIPLLGGINPVILSGPISYNVPDSTPVIVKTINTTSEVIIITGTSLSTIQNFYKNQFLRVLPYGNAFTNPIDIKYQYNPLPSNNQARRIISYGYYEDSSSPGTFYGVFTVYPVFNLYNEGIGASIEILPFSYDNFNPFVYSGSLVSQQDMVCYEMQMISLTLPNYTLAVSQGGRIAFYPYVYVQISNVSATGAGLKNIIYSNNPNATNIIFRAPIYDVQNPISTPFVRIDGEGMSQTIKFKPNDNLYFKVSMSTGETYKTILQEFYSPASPNQLNQITALFSFKRIS